MTRSSIMAAAALLLAPAAAVAQGYANAPFEDEPVALAQAAALERIGLTAQALSLSPPSADPEGERDEEEEEEGGPLADLALLRASLAAASPDLAASLGAAIQEMLDAAEEGRDASGPATTAADLTEEAHAALPAVRAKAPEFRAALMASLLLEEGGVAESYEEAAAGEEAAYVQGWLALGRVKGLWQELAAGASLARAAEVEAALAALDRLFPGADLPEDLSPNPEEAEAPAHQLVALLEGVVDADLYPGRDLGRAAGLVHRIAEGACARLRVGESDLAAEELAIAAAYHTRTVSDTLRVLAPEVEAAVQAGLVGLDPTQGDAACAPLLAALDAGRSALSP